MIRVTQWLEEYALASRGALPEPELAQRVTALRDMGRNFHDLSTPQLKEVMTTAHFADYFGDALSRMFLEDYAYQPGSWLGYTKPDTAPDFRDVKRFKMSQPGTLYPRYEKGEALATDREITKYEYGVDQFSRQFDVSWEALKNDDLGQIKQTPLDMVTAARTWLDGFVSNLYDNAITQAGLIALGAVYGGTGRLTAANLAVGLNAMRMRVDGGGLPIQISRIHLVIPTILEIQAAQILRDLLSYGGVGGNVLSSFIVKVHVDPYIGWAGANVPWYLFADPAEITTVPVVRLQGWPGPVAFMKQSDISVVSGSAPPEFLMGNFATGDIEFQVVDIVGGNSCATYGGVVDVNGIYYSSGTTP